MPEPTSESDRIVTLDILRGFALLGILLINIVGFGMVSAAYTGPALANLSPADEIAWLLTELTTEGAMRTLFSFLFGAGVILFLGRGEGEGEGEKLHRGWLHYKRTFWLLIFGLFNGYILLWTGDILLTYALAGFLLYFFRNTRGSRLLTASIILIILVSLYNAAMTLSLEYIREVSDDVVEMQAEGKPVPEGMLEATTSWQDFKQQIKPDGEYIAQELSARRASYTSAWSWTLIHNTEFITQVLPMFMLPDAIVAMLLGMALFRLGILQGNRSDRFYQLLAIAGFTVGLSINAFEAWRAWSSHYDILASFPIIQPTYHLGRIALALGWMGLIILLVRRLQFGRHLAAVGRMALTNYLMQSLLCMFIFTGAGLGLVGELSRAELYLVVLAIWILQLWYSPWWLSRYQYGPMEWLWRMLTYGHLPAFRRITTQGNSA